MLSYLVHLPAWIRISPLHMLSMLWSIATLASGDPGASLVASRGTALSSGTSRATWRSSWHWGTSVKSRGGKAPSLCCTRFNLALTYSPRAAYESKSTFGFLKAVRGQKVPCSMKVCKSVPQMLGDPTGGVRRDLYSLLSSSYFRFWTLACSRLTKDRVRASTELWLDPGPSKNFLFSTSLNFNKSRRRNISAPWGSSTEIAPLCISWMMSAFAETMSFIACSEIFGWKASSGGMSAEVSFAAIAKASAASGWKTKAACPCLMSLETWGRDWSAAGNVSASTTRWSTSVLSCRRSVLVI